MNQLYEVWVRSECIVPIILLRSNSGTSRIKSCSPRTHFWRMKGLSSFFILVFSWFVDVIKVSNLILALLQRFSWADQTNCIFSFFPTWNSICWLQFLKVWFRSTHQHFCFLIRPFTIFPFLVLTFFRLLMFLLLGMVMLLYLMFW